MATQRPAVFHCLAIVDLRGFDPAEDEEVIDPPGTANWLCEDYGMAPDDFDDPDAHGILWVDYDPEGWRFLALLSAAAATAFADHAMECGYEVLSVKPVEEPTHFGDGHQGTVAVCQHPDGWVVVR